MKLELKYKILIAASVFITLLLAWFIWPTPYKSYTTRYTEERYVSERGTHYFLIIKENRITHTIYSKDIRDTFFVVGDYANGGEVGYYCHYKFGIIVCHPPAESKPPVKRKPYPWEK